LLTANLLLTFATTDSDHYQSQLPWKIIHWVYSHAITYLSICDQSDCESSHQKRSRCIYEHHTTTKFFWYGKVYYSNTIIITILM
jgi:hypothetical protein